MARRRRVRRAHGRRRVLAAAPRRARGNRRSRRPRRTRPASTGSSSSRTRRSAARSCWPRSAQRAQGRARGCSSCARRSTRRFVTGSPTRTTPARRRRRASTRAWRAMRAAGLEAEGEIGDGDPIQAIEDAIRTFRPDELIISTHPAGRSHWLERGVVEKARERFEIELTHVVVDLARRRSSSLIRCRLRAELREVHRSALGAGALSDEWAEERLPAHAAARRVRVPRRARRRMRSSGFALRLHGRVRALVDRARRGGAHAGAAGAVARSAALRDRGAARPAGAPAPRPRQCAARAAPDAPAARPRDPDDAGGLAQGARRSTRRTAGRSSRAIDFGAGYPPYVVLGKRLERRLPGTHVHLGCGGISCLQVRTIGSRGPALLAGVEETNLATALISAAESWPLNAGIAPPPTSTWCSTVASDGFSWSRFGPTLPVAPASFSVWQLAAAGRGEDLSCRPAPPPPPPPPVVVVAGGGAVGRRGDAAGRVAGALRDVERDVASRPGRGTRFAGIGSSG